MIAAYQRADPIRVAGEFRTWLGAQGKYIGSRFITNFVGVEAVFHSFQAANDSKVGL